MKILIIGARGMLGQALGRAMASEKPVMWDIGDIDITKGEQAYRKIAELKPEVIFNVAAMTNVDACEDNPALASSLNAEAPAMLARTANEIGATLVHYSTSYVFDGQSSEPYAEDAPPSPRSVYGQTKLQGERAAQTAGKHYVIRLDRLFGPAGNGKQSFVDLMLQKAVTEKELRLVSDEWGCPTYSEDLAKFSFDLLTSGRPYGLYHGANSGYCSWYEWGKEIFRLKGLSVNVSEASSADFPRKAERPRRAVLISTKLPAQRSWQEALAEYLARSSNDNE